MAFKGGFRLQKRGNRGSLKDFIGKNLYFADF
jgi:hypothetical protein